jgi:NADH:ubiquinone oxidoreductase subunit 4 (subunit M)
MTQAPLYTINKENGWRQYAIENLLPSQCDIVKKSCAKEADFERFKSIAIAAGTVLGVVGVVLIAFATAKISAIFFAGMVGKFGILAGCEVPAFVLFSTRVFTYLLTYTFGLIALKKVWTGGSQAVKNHWNYAAHLDQQALDAQLYKAKLENQPPEE